MAFEAPVSKLTQQIRFSSSQWGRHSSVIQRSCLYLSYQIALACIHCSEWPPILMRLGSSTQEPPRNLSFPKDKSWKSWALLLGLGLVRGNLRLNCFAIASQCWNTVDRTRLAESDNFLTESKTSWFPLLNENVLQFVYWVGETLASQIENLSSQYRTMFTQYGGPLKTSDVRHCTLKPPFSDECIQWFHSGPDYWKGKVFSLLNVHFGHLESSFDRFLFRHGLSINSNFSFLCRQVTMSGSGDYVPGSKVSLLSVSSNQLN